ncbi:hypothetical protein P775_23275 [Puniceibacterium antarcticum]|uniref:Uncharacterized protein n=1 Tax=Puniceibacterium antarcticum TaxID=1206336 RepID=A0A2G8R8A7_9RHOB|nr:hypothetical protein P775_23275 [Puniceibacterium antarcticum]
MQPKNATWASSALPVKTPLTQSIHSKVDPTTEVETSVIHDAIVHTYEYVVPETISLPIWRAAYDQLNRLAELKDNWGGSGHKPARDSTLSDAELFLGHLEVELPDGPAPMIGLDEDGYVVLTWDDAHVVGSLSIFDDGTYEFYIEGRHGSLGVGSVDVDDLFIDGFIEILTA